MGFIFGFIGVADAVFTVIVNAPRGGQVALGVLALLSVVSVIRDDRQRG